MNKRFENRLNTSNIKFNTQNPVWDNEKGDALNVFEMINLMNELNDEYNDFKYNKCFRALQKNYDFAIERMKDKEVMMNPIVYQAYKMLAYTMYSIGEELGIQIQRF